MVLVGCQVHGVASWVVFSAVSVEVIHLKLFDIGKHHVGTVIFRVHSHIKVKSEVEFVEEELLGRQLHIRVICIVVQYLDAKLKLSNDLASDFSELDIHVSVAQVES